MTGRAGGAAALSMAGTGRVGRWGWAWRAPLVALLVVVTVLLPAAEAVAQESGGPRNYRRWLYAATGAVIGFVPAALSRPSGGETGPCVSRGCLMSVATIAGATVGFMIGRERDEAAAAKYVAGPSARLQRESVDLRLLPERVESFDGGAVVVGREGLVAVGADRVPRSRGGQLRGITSAVAVPAHDALLASTMSGLFSFGLRGDLPDGRLILNEPGNALAVVGASHVVMGSGPLLRRLRLSGQGSRIELAEEARADATGTVVTDLAYASYAGVLWMLARDRLMAWSASGLEELGNVRLPATGRSISLSGDRALVAAGSEGLVLVDIERPEAPRVVAHVRGIRFAHDAVLVGKTAYVAVGNGGVLILDLEDPASPRTVGVVRDIGFASGLARGAGDEIYVVDREGQRLYVVQTGVQGGASDRE